MSVERRLWIICFFVFLAIIAGLWSLQVKDFNYYRVISSGNYLKVVSLPAKRGRILDRHNRPIAEDVQIYSCVVYPQEVKNLQYFFKEVSLLLEVDAFSLKRLYKRNFVSRFLPVVLKDELSRKELQEIKRNLYRIKGLGIIRRFRRYYHYPYEFSNLVGYVGYTTKEEYFLFKKYGLSPPRRIGHLGLEKYYDEYLRGKDGGRIIIVDASSHKIRTLQVKYPLKGNDIELTLNVDIQRLAFQALKGKKGCIIFGRPQGEILALVSFPGFDSQKFTQRNSSYINKVLRSLDAPLYNRALQGRYPPGSIFKLVVATAGLEESVITDKTQFFCPGEFLVGQQTFKCWMRHGLQDVREALKNSCNVFFYNVGLLLGPQRILKYAHMLGLGRRVFSYFPSSAGFLPSPEWKQFSLRRSWTKGDTCNLSIGQGWVLTTPLQVYRMVSSLAQGRFSKPYIIRRIGTLDIEPSQQETLEASRVNLDTVRDGMRRAVRDKGGTAHILEDLKLKICAKTGTAQTNRAPHSWVAGFFPYKKPRYVFVVFLEHGGSSFFACKTAHSFLKSLREEGLLDEE